MPDKYFGDFHSRESLIHAFSTSDLPSEDQILFASYDCPPYEGYAFVLYEQDGKLYEVNGSHCSCYGLEGQWEPEETTWSAIAIRTWSLNDEGSAIHALVTAHVQLLNA